MDSDLIELYPYAVNVRYTLPLMISLGPGLYVVLSIIGLLNVPSPLLVHSREDWFVALPLTWYVTPSHMVSGLKFKIVTLGDWENNSIGNRIILVIVFSYDKLTEKFMRNIKEKKVGVAGLQPTLYMHVQSNLLYELHQVFSH